MTNHLDPSTLDKTKRPTFLTTLRRTLTRSAIAVGVLLTTVGSSQPANAAQTGELIYYEPVAHCDPLKDTITLQFRAGTTRETNQTIWAEVYVHNYNTGRGHWLSDAQGRTTLISFIDERVKRFENSWGGGLIINDSEYTQSPQWMTPRLANAPYAVYTRYWWHNGSKWVSGGLWNQSFQNYYQTGWSNKYCWLNDQH